VRLPAPGIDPPGHGATASIRYVGVVASARDSRILRAIARAVPVMDERLPQKRGEHERYQKAANLPEVPEADDVSVSDPKDGGATGTKEL
jgi:hypothetical protein